MLLMHGMASSQVYPVNVTTTVTPPNPTKLTDFYSASNTSFKATVIFSDLTKPSINVKLRVRIESNNIKIETKTDYTPATPLTLSSGSPTLLQSTDFSNYLSTQNINVTGADKNAFFTNGGKLPEGFYQICITVLDYRTGIPISQPGCAMVNIFQEQPPRLLKPECEKMVKPLNPQSVFFSWQASPGGSPTLAANSLYTLSVWKIIDENADGLAAVQNGQSTPIYKSNANNLTTLNMDLTTTQLDVGYRYAFQVRATDMQGRDVYDNNGKSEFCWFYFGYPEGGEVVLKYPKEAYAFGRNEDKIFEWSAPDKRVQNQPFEYTIKIVEVNNNQTPADAMRSNSSWFSQAISSTTSIQGATFELTKLLDTDQLYAWQITTKSGTQTVAESKVGSFYGPPLIDAFNAGNFKVLVKRTENKDLNNLKGKGLVKLSAAEGDTLPCDFDSISVKEISGQHFLQNGEVIFDLSKRAPIVLKPKEADDVDAKFVFQKGKLTKRGLYYGGVVEYPIPHPLIVDSVGVLKTGLNYYQVDKDYKIAGTGEVFNNQSFELADPYKHTLKIAKNSIIKVGANLYEFSLKGSLTLPKKILTNDKKAYELSFTEAKNLYTIKVPYLLSNAKNHFTPIKNSTFAIKPVEAIIDLNESSSPGIKEVDKGWKGVYFPEFKAVFPAKLDKKKQITTKYATEFRQKVNGDTIFFTTSEGLFLNWAFDIIDQDLKFNSFPATLSGVLNIEKGQFKKSEFTGEFNIPFLSQTEKFVYRIPVTADGIKTAFLDQDIVDRELSFNPYGNDNRIDVTVKRAVFKEGKYLQMTLDLEHQGLDSKFTGVTDFRAYGDNYIGFGGKNGTKSLPRTISGSYAGFSFLIDEVMASYDNGFYHIAFLSDVSLGKRLSGKDGSPSIAFSSVMQLFSDYLPNEEDNNAVAEVPYKKDMEKKKKINGGCYIEIKNAMNDFKGWIELIHDDPNLGTVFAGDIEGKLLLPLVIPMKANIIIGDNKGDTYWYFDSYFQDKEGVGIPVISPFNCVGFEGRMYHHMKYATDAFVFDKGTDLAQTSYLQIIDGKTGGGLFQSDWVADMKITNSKTSLTVKGDISCINQTRRKGAATTLAAMAGSKLVKAATSVQSIDTKIDLNKTGTLGIQVSGSEQKFSYQDNGKSVYASFAQKSNEGIPGAYLKLEKGNYTLEGEGFSNGVYAMKLADKSNSLKFGSKEKGQAFADGTLKGVDIKSTYAYNTKLAKGTLGYQGKTLEFTANGSDKYARADFTYEKGKTMYGMYKSKKGFAGFSYDNVKYDMEVDPSNEVVDMTMDVSGSLLGATYWANDKKGKVTFKNSSYDFVANSTNKIVGDAQLTKGAQKINVTFDKPTKSGTVQYIHSSNAKFYGELNNAKFAYLEMDVDGNKFGIGGNTGADSGRVLFKNNDFDITVKAQPKKKIGALSFDYKNDYSVRSQVKVDSSYASFKGEGYTVSVSGYGKGFGRLQLAKGDYKADVIGNKAQKYGSLYLTNGQTTISAAGCKSGISKAVAEKYKGIQGEFGSFSYKDAQYDFGGYLVPKDTVRGALFVNGSGISAAGNKTSKYDIQLKDPGAVLDIHGKLKDRKLTFNYEESLLTFDAQADFSAEAGFFELKEGTVKYRFDATASESKLLLSKSAYKASASRNSTEYSMDYTKGSNSLKLTSDVDDSETTLELKTSAVRLSMKDNGDIKIEEGSDVVEIEETLTAGLQIKENGTTKSGNSSSLKTTNGKIKSSIKGNEKTIEYNGTNKITLSSNGKNGELTATIDGKTWTASNTSAAVNMQCNNTSYTIENKILSITESSTKKIEINPNGGKVTYGTLTTDLNVDDRLSFKESNYKYVAWMDEIKGIAIQKQDQKVIVDLTEKILLQYDPTKYLKIENATLDFKLDKVTMFIDPTKKLVYDDKENYFELGPQKFELLRGVTGVSLDADDFKLAIDASNYVKLGTANLDFKVKGVGVAFDAQNPLKFEYGDFKFDLGTSGLSFNHEGIELGLKELNGLANLNLKNPLGEVDINTNGLGLTIGTDLELDINSDYYLRLKALDRSLAFGLNKVVCLDSLLDVGFEFGGKHLAALNIKDYSIAIPSVGGIDFTLPKTNFDISISPDLALNLDFSGFKMDFMKNGFPLDVNIGSMGLKLPNISNGFEANIDLSGFDADLKSIEGEFTSFVLGTDMLGHANFGRDVNANTVIGYKKSGCSFELKVGTDGLSGTKQGSCSAYNLPPVFFPTSGAPPKDTPAGKIPATDKPKYLTDKITDKAKGLSKGNMNMTVNTKNSTIKGSADWNSNQVICAKAKMNFESDGKNETWKLEVGTKNNPVTIKPGCSNDFKGKGYLRFENDGAYVYAKKSVNLSLSTKIGDETVGAKLSTDFKTSLAFGSGIKLDPLELKKFELEVNSTAKIDASYWFIDGKGSLTLGSVSVSGDLEMTPPSSNTSMKIKGDLEGKVNILDIITEDFKFKIDETFN